MKLLDHGYVDIIEHYGSDQSIIEAARMSTDKGFLGWGPTKNACKKCEGLGYIKMKDCGSCRGTGFEPGDEKLLRYLYENKHSTPFEMAGLIIEVKAPIFVYRQWHRHRTQCLAGTTLVHFQRPDNGRAYKMPIAEVWRKWQPTERRDRPERQENALWNRTRVAGMALRCVNEETKAVQLTRVVDVIKSAPKQLYRLTTINGRSIRASADHRFLTDRGWMRLEDAVNMGTAVAVETTAKQLAEAWELEVDLATEQWRDVVGWEGLYEVSNMGRARRCGRSAKRPTVGAQGYPVVSLNRPGMQQTRTVHTLVLEAWYGPKPSGREARHVNSNRRDARADNLLWGTAQENAADRIARGSQQSLGVLFEEIRSCVADGVEETYDISVEGPWHNFIADGCVVHNSYNEMSARYTPLPDENYLPTVERLMLDGGKNKQARGVTDIELTGDNAMLYLTELEKQYEEQERFYQWALAIGVGKELARVHVGVGRYSKMRAHANLRNWLAFLTLRMDPHAQWEIRQYANAVGNIIKERFPRTWELFVEDALLPG